MYSVLPSELKSASMTRESECPVRRWTGVAVAVFQTMASPSSPVLTARRESGENSMLWTGAECASVPVTLVPVARWKKCTLPLPRP